MFAAPTNNHEHESLLTVKEVAAILSVAVRTVWQWAAMGEIPRPIHIGRATRWRRADLDALIRQRATEAEAERRADRAEFQARLEGD